VSIVFVAVPVPEVLLLLWSVLPLLINAL
jgi:hypothetical protein